MKLEELIAELAPYRRALREEDRQAFDALMNKARRYASASGYQAPADPLDTAVLSMLLGLEKELAEMRRKMRSLQRGESEIRDGTHGNDAGGSTCQERIEEGEQAKNG